MILDKRILKGKKPLTCLDFEEAREFKGKVCIFSDSYVNYKNILEYMKNPQCVGILELDNSEETEDYIFRNAHDGYKYCLALPLEWVDDEEDVDYHELSERVKKLENTVAKLLERFETTERRASTLSSLFSGDPYANCSSEYIKMMVK